jgi:hypothetical protein
MECGQPGSDTNCYELRLTTDLFSLNSLKFTQFGEIKQCTQFLKKLDKETERRKNK